jgi:hypothetical protein
MQHHLPAHTEREMDGWMVCGNETLFSFHNHPYTSTYLVASQPASHHVPYPTTYVVTALHLVKHCWIICFANILASHWVEEISLVDVVA